MRQKRHLSFLSRSARDQHENRQQDCAQYASRTRDYLTSSSRTLPADKFSPTRSSRQNFESNGYLPSSRKVCVSDADLIHRLYQATQKSKQGRLLCAPSMLWDSKDLSTSAMLSRQMENPNGDFEILTMGDIACEPYELEPLLFPRAESTYNTVARDFLGDQFIYGSIVHEIQGLDDGTAKKDATVYGLDHATVRTACFARSRRFARNEEWCFLTHFRPHVVPSSNMPTPSNSTASSSSSSNHVDEHGGFTIILSTLPENELSAGKMKKDRVTQLHGITATYVVEPAAPTVEARGPRCRVSFHATFTASKTVPDGYADADLVRTRLVRLAKSLHRLPELVRPRQQGPSRSYYLQASYSSRSGIETRTNDQAYNSRCVACTKRLRLKLLDAPTRRSKRCQICMYRACASCWSKANVETYNGHTTSMVVCRRCHENFGNSEYSHIQLTNQAGS